MMISCRLQLLGNWYEMYAALIMKMENK